MQEVFAIALVSMQQDMTRLDRVALNLANVSTPGYRREVVAVRPFAQVLDGAEAAQRAVVAAASEVAAQAPGRVEVLSDTRPGTIRVTAVPLDVALTGDGFLEVSTESGLAYTRQGNLRIDARGRLVTSQGDAVMGKNGDIHLTTQTPVIDASGFITEPNATTGPSAAAPGTPVAQLKVVRFENPRAMQRLGDGLLAPGDGMTVVEDGNAHVRQGALENANVTSAQEMMQLIQTMRHFESMQRVAQGYDEMLGMAIRKLGDLT
jgi:flagellar basal-body rod protein FlgG